MFHLCENCPDITNLSNYLKNIFEDNGFDDDDKTNYKQWVATDHIALACIQSTVDEFIQTVTEMIYDLCHHHFIKNSQASYLRDSKENLDNKTSIILMDFAENYSFIIQDTIQGFYWQLCQATLHPFAVYYRDLSTNELRCGSYCAISDHLKHNQTTVHCFRTKLLSLIRKDLPYITSIKYFTDGAASQYKNLKALFNLAFHFHDHKLTAEHNLFATSNVKSPCDGIGGTIKREAANASLRATTDNQIITPEDLCCWAKNKIKRVTLFYVLSIEIIEHERRFALESQYSSASAVDGTMSYHCFIPQKSGCLIMKRISVGCYYDKHEFFNLDLQNDCSQYKRGKYVTCFYDGNWYIGMLL